MLLSELLEQYKVQVAICDAIDYADKKTVKANNKAVAVMQKIVDAIKNDFGHEGITQFASLLDISEKKISLWVATQLLENKLPVDDSIQEKALKIIKETAKGNTLEALGFQMWLSDWEKKNKS